MESSPYFSYSFLSPIYHENIYAYEPSDEFLSVATQFLTEDWLVKRRGFWASCSPKGRVDLEHGWKIHISSTQDLAIETLAICAKTLASAGIAFKFCADRRMLKMSLSKGWSRFQIGKFLTIYPKDVSEFTSIIDTLHRATAHLTGPHILTDRAYLTSKVVYYRYGVHRGIPRVDATGSRVSGFFLTNGEWYNDIRGPSFRLPPGIKDPLASEVPRVNPSENHSQQPKTVLLKNRFVVQGAIKFNATGGIYRGVDSESGREIIIREVRGKLGHLEGESPSDPTFILKREARILKTLSPSGLVPEYIDLFQEWDHWFLVVEKLDAISLWGHSMEFYFSNEHQDVDFGLDKILSSIEEIGSGLAKIHAHGIVLRDLTKNNILFTKDSNKVKFIDFEFAFEVSDSGPWVAGWTPGYASAEQASSQRPTIADDCYAFGVLILDMLTFSASGLELGRSSIFRKLELVLFDLGLPRALYDLVSGLTNPDLSVRWDIIAHALEHLNAIELLAAKRTMFPSRKNLLVVDQPSSDLSARLLKILAGLRSFIDSTVDLSRADRLWPAAPEVFTTNPVSLEYGAAGVAHFLQNLDRNVPNDVLDWIQEKTATAVCPPGLYSGISGVALLLHRAGRTTFADRLIRSASEDELVFQRPGLYYGCAGIGLANLHFWVDTGDESYLLEATKIGDWLVANAQQAETGIYWNTAEKVYLGLGEGQSGVALFLIYLSVASRKSHFADAAEKALMFDISHARRVAGRLVWKVHTVSKEHAPNLPHTKFGSAGIGSVCIRYFALTGKDYFKEVALDCAHTIRTRMSNKIWQDEGSAGYGEFLLDMATFLGEPAFRDIAFFQAEAIMAHALERPTGIAFGGMDHYRICLDYSYGSAGIGIFIDRLLNGSGRFLMLDNLLNKAKGALPQQIVSVESAY